MMKREQSLGNLVKTGGDEAVVDSLNQPISVSRIEPYLQTLIPKIRVHKIKKFGNGQSNPTYLIFTNSKKLVLRCKPMGHLLPSAHLVEREFRVMQALRQTDIPVPKMVALAHDKESPLGRAFFIMEYVSGEVFFDPALPEMRPSQRAGIYDVMNNLLASLHKITPHSIGLGSFGRPGNYFARQTHIWEQQCRNHGKISDPHLWTLISWLKHHMIETDEPLCLVHGDYRLDNFIIDRKAAQPVALLDWELSTLGHPLADLGYQCAQWRLPHQSEMKGLGGLERELTGLPTEEAYVEDYCRRRAIPVPEDWHFYLAFGLFRLAAILLGVEGRGREGNASNPQKARKLGKLVPILTKMALDVVESR